MPRVIFREKGPTPLNYQAMRDVLVNALEAGGILIRKDFESTVSTWNKKPQWQPSSTTPVERGHHAIAETSVVDDVYGWVERGTEPHIIVPVRARALRFPGTFTAKTVPGVIGSGPGYSGPPIIYSKGVLHPGIKPRDFESKIAEKAKSDLPIRLKIAMAKAQSISTHRKP